MADLLQHLSAFLRVLRKRSERDPCPFHNPRIAFIDQWFVSQWVGEYKQFDMNPKRWKFGQGYFDLAKGLIPRDHQTNKKWYYDVDHLYIVHQTGGNHWIALDVDLLKEKIDCYDSIMGEGTAEQDKKMLEACRPFTRMIPALLNEFVPPHIRKPSNKQFAFRKRRGIPQNYQVGDCGIYTLKYIEMLALGVSFEGLSDRNIQAFREKMAAEIFDEAPDMYAQFNR